MEAERAAKAGQAAASGGRQLRLARVEPLVPQSFAEAPRVSLPERSELHPSKWDDAASQSAAAAASSFPVLPSTSHVVRQSVALRSSPTRRRAAPVAPSALSASAPSEEAPAAAAVAPPEVKASGKRRRSAAAAAGDRAEAAAASAPAVVAAAAAAAAVAPVLESHIHPALALPNLFRTHWQRRRAPVPLSSLYPYCSPALSLAIPFSLGETAVLHPASAVAAPAVAAHAAGAAAVLAPPVAPAAAAEARPSKKQKRIRGQVPSAPSAVEQLANGGEEGDALTIEGEQQQQRQQQQVQPLASAMVDGAASVAAAAAPSAAGPSASAFSHFSLDDVDRAEETLRESTPLVLRKLADMLHVRVDTTPAEASDFQLLTHNHEWRQLFKIKLLQYWMQ